MKNINSSFQEYLRLKDSFLISQLPKGIQKTAIESVILYELEVNLLHLNSARQSIKNNIHECINNPHFIKRFINKGDLFKKINEDANNFAYNYVDQNLCEFDNMGNYIPVFNVLSN